MQDVWPPREAKFSVYRRRNPPETHPFLNIRKLSPETLVNGTFWGEIWAQGGCARIMCSKGAVSTFQTGRNGANLPLVEGVSTPISWRGATECCWRALSLAGKDVRFL